MELSLALADLITFIQSNFWYLMCIFVLLKYRTPWGILLLFSHVILGFKIWVYIPIMIIALIDYTSDPRYINKEIIKDNEKEK